METLFELRPANRTDAHAIAELIDLAGEGIPMMLWEESRAEGVSALDHGESRAARQGVAFCYENATIASAGDAIAGMVLAYTLEEEEFDLDEIPKLVRPLVLLEAELLEAEAPGTFYINAIGVRDGHRNQGVGSALMRTAEDAGRAAGCNQASLIVADDNPARRLYERMGYQETSRRPVVPFDGFPHGGDWLLMVKDISR